jgi:putative transposase
VTELATTTSVQQACEALGYPRSSYYREAQPSPPPAEGRSRPRPGRALAAEEREKVRQILNSERFLDCAPREVYATLLDEGRYYCSIRTMYRILEEHDEVRERRNQKRHPVYTRPELVATAPNQVWTWDITWLRGPVPYSYYALYVILDLYSRYVVGYMIAEQESAALAERLIAETCAKQGIERDALTLHSDRGSAMTSKTVALLLQDLGVVKSHTRPYTPNDNPYSEAQFKTMKYRPDYPDRFASPPLARVWAHDFFDWYNNHHHHTGLGLMTPADVHYGRAEEVIRRRQVTLQAAYEQHPERFVNGPPQAPQLPKAVWINPPVMEEDDGPSS